VGLGHLLAQPTSPKPVEAQPKKAVPE